MLMLTRACCCLRAKVLDAHECAANGKGKEKQAASERHLPYNIHSLILLH
jgi:hypothetical protein